MRDITHDIVTMLSNCAEAVDALDENVDDAKRANDRDVSSFFEEIRKDESRHCDLARNLINNFVKQGKF